MNIRIPTLMLTAVLGARASVGPAYQRPELQLPGAFPGATATDSAIEIRADWWTLYGDPTLDTLIRSALERNADIRIAVARIEETDANLREADAAFLPEITLGSSGSRSRVSQQNATPIPGGVSPIRNSVRLAASTSFELDFWGRLRRGVEAVRATALASRYSRDTVALTLTGLVAQSYFSLRSLDAQTIILRETLKTRDESLSLARRRAEAGVASDLELNQAESSRADAAIQLADILRQRALIEHQLAILAGSLDLTVAGGDIRTLPLPPAPPVGLPSSLLARRPDIAQAEAALMAANAQIGVARAELFPLVSLTGTYGSESRALASLLTTGAGIWSIGFAMTLPIFDAGRRAARVDAAEARERQVLFGYQKAVETGFREVADALTNVASSRGTEADYTARANAARNALRLATRRYEAGYSSFLEVLDAQRTSNEAELAVIRNRLATLSASVDLMKALGGGWATTQAINTGKNQ